MLSTQEGARWKGESLQAPHRVSLGGQDRSFSQEFPFKGVSVTTVKLVKETVWAAEKYTQGRIRNKVLSFHSTPRNFCFFISHQ